MFSRSFLRGIVPVALKFLNSKCKSTSSSCRRVILDCDPGTDDAIALMVLLSAELKKLVKIEMITCTRGNASLKNVCRNTIRLLQMANRTDIPVYKGSHEALLPSRAPEDCFHGADGFGDLQHDSEPDLTLIRQDPSFMAMRDLIVNNSKEITVICLGPLTNIALLMRMYDDVKCHIKELYIMGGNHLGIGNAHPAAEFNFFMDPEAAHIVLSSVECPLHLLPWETCLNTRIPFDWRMDNLGDSGGDTWKLIDRAEKEIYKPNDNWMPCDAFLIAAMLYPGMVCKRIKRHLGVELAGRHTRGQVAVDHINKQQPNSTIITKIDSKSFQNLMCDVHREF